MGSGAGDIYAGAHGASAASDVLIADEQSSQADSRDEASNAAGGKAITSTGSVEANAAKLDERFELRMSGYFCERGTGGRGWLRQYAGIDPKADAREFFDTLAQGSIVERQKDGKAMRATLGDGAVVYFREETSTPGSPAVNIGHSPSVKVKNQKIHFIKKEQ